MDQRELKNIFRSVLIVSQTYLKYPLKIVEINEGIIFEDEQFKVEARLLNTGFLHSDIGLSKRTGRELFWSIN